MAAFGMWWSTTSRRLSTQRRRLAMYLPEFAPQSKPKIKRLLLHSAAKVFSFVKTGGGFSLKVDGCCVWLNHTTHIRNRFKYKIKTKPIKSFYYCAYLFGIIKLWFLWFSESRSFSNWFDFIIGERSFASGVWSLTSPDPFLLSRRREVQLACVLIRDISTPHPQ